MVMLYADNAGYETSGKSRSLISVTFRAEVSLMKK